MSTRDYGRWMSARDAGGKGETEAMVVPGGVLVRVTEAYKQEALATSLVFVPVSSYPDQQTFLARLGCDLRVTLEPAPASPPRRDPS